MLLKHSWTLWETIQTLVHEGLLLKLHHHHHLKPQPNVANVVIYTPARSGVVPPGQQPVQANFDPHGSAQGYSFGAGGASRMGPGNSHNFGYRGYMWHQPVRVGMGGRKRTTHRYPTYRQRMLKKFARQVPARCQLLLNPVLAGNSNFSFKYSSFQQSFN